MKYLLSFIILFGTPTSVQASDENGEIFCLVISQPLVRLRSAML
jgi:hypothetical protein